MAIEDTRFVNGAQRLGQRIATIRAKLSLPPMVEEIGELLLRRTQDRFKKEVDPDGIKWQDLKPVTLEIKRRLGYGAKGKLVRTEALYKSIQLIRGGIAGSIFTNTGAGIRIGITNPAVVDYARIQNNGLKSKNIPARRFLGIGALDVKSVDSFLRRRGDDAVG